MEVQISKQLIDGTIEHGDSAAYQGFVAGPHAEKLLLNYVNDFLYSKSSYPFFDDLKNIPMTSEWRTGVFQFYVAAVIFDFKKNMVGWAAYGWLLWLYTENGRELWHKSDKLILARIRECRFRNYIYYLATRLFSFVYLPYFLFKMRKMKKKWNNLEIYIYLYEPIAKVRKQYFD